MTYEEQKKNFPTGKEIFDRVIKKAKIRFQWDYQLRSLGYLTVFDWFPDKNHHKYIALILEDKDTKDKDVKEILIEMHSDQIINLISQPSQKTKFGKWLVKQISKKL